MEEGVALATALPPPLLARIASAALAAQGLPAIFALSATCTALRAACNDVLATTTAIAPTGLRGPLVQPCSDEENGCYGACDGCRDRAVAARVIARALRAAPQLTRLDLSGAYWLVTDSVLREIGAARPHTLRALVLDHCERITSYGLSFLTYFKSQLVELSINGCGDVVDGSFLIYAPSLRTLRAAFCRGLSCFGKQFQGIRSMGQWTTLDVTGCDGGCDALCSRLPAVEWLSLALAENVSDAGLAALAARSPRLRRLTLARRSNNVFSTGKWTEAGLAAFRRQRPEVEVNFIM